MSSEKSTFVEVFGKYFQIINKSFQLLSVSIFINNMTT